MRDSALECWVCGILRPAQLEIQGSFRDHSYHEAQDDLNLPAFLGLLLFQKRKTGSGLPFSTNSFEGQTKGHMGMGFSKEISKNAENQSVDNNMRKVEIIDLPYKAPRLIKKGKKGAITWHAC